MLKLKTQRWQKDDNVNAIIMVQEQSHPEKKYHALQNCCLWWITIVSFYHSHTAGGTLAQIIL